MSRSPKGKGISIEDRDDVNAALIFFNMGDLGTGETCFVVADLIWKGESMIDVQVRRGRMITRECEFLLSEIGIEWESNVAALIEIPEVLVSIFDLRGLVLTGDELERHRRYVKEFNAPKLPPVPTRQLETVGGVRI